MSRAYHGLAHREAGYAVRQVRALGGAVERSGRVVRVRYQEDAVTHKGGGVRGRVETWSAASRRRLLQAVARIDWRQLGDRPLEVTLTYPTEWIGHAPEGRAAKQQLGALMHRWRRTYGAPAVMWKLEFQKRGAPHFHLLIGQPAGVDLAQLQGWLSRSWWEVVGSRDQKHLRAGTRVQEVRDRQKLGAYFAGYLTDAKGQEQPPEGWPPGRWWGTSQGLLQPWVGQEELPVGAAARVNRALRGVAASRGPLRGPRDRGRWLIVRGDVERFSGQLGHLAGWDQLLSP